MKTSHLVKPILLWLLLFSATIANCGTLVLKKAFVTKFKDRATIDATFVVDHAHKKPNPGAKDGDMHVGGRAPNEIGLPMVAEVMNAKDEKTAVDRIHADEGKNVALKISGAWRLWFEHPADSQIQFDEVPVAETTNPDHSFEIHPILSFSGIDVSDSFREIPDFDPHEASKAFASYEKLSGTVSGTNSAITITATKTGFNYTEFRIQLKGTPKKLDDGGFAVFADVFDRGSKESDDALAENVRMIFVPGTPPLKKLLEGKLGDEDELDVIGIPRLNLNAIQTFVTASHGANAKRKLPYEMIIVAILKSK